MKHVLELSPSAEPSLNKIPRGDFLRMDPAIRQLADNPRPHGVVKLKENVHRIRVGPWRIIYVILDEEKIVSVLDVVRRSESTYKRHRN